MYMGRARSRQRQQNTTVLQTAGSPNSQGTTVNGQAVASDPAMWKYKYIIEFMLGASWSQEGSGSV